MSVKTKKKKQRKIAAVKATVCDGSPFCPAKRSCPQGAIVQDKAAGLAGMLGMSGGIARVDKEKCTGCGVCVQNCPMGAISMK